MGYIYGSSLLCYMYFFFTFTIADLLKSSKHCPTPASQKRDDMLSLTYVHTFIIGTSIKMLLGKSARP